MPVTAELPNLSPTLQVIEGDAPPRAPRGSMAGTVPQFDVPTIEKKPKKERVSAPAPDARGRAVIALATGEIAGIADAAEDALAAAGLGVYQRGGEIVHVTMALGRDNAGNEVKNPGVKALGEYALQEALCSAALFEKFDARKGEYSYCNPPLELSKTLMQRGRSRLPVLAGFASAPTLRADGSVLETEGFDEPSGLLLEFEGVEYPEVPQNPTIEDARIAMNMLDALLNEFPFVLPHHRSAALSLLLTAVVRQSLPLAPMHAITAHTSSTGKSFLADLPSLLLTGNKAECSTWTGDIAEDKKSLHALLARGAQVIQLDNVPEGVSVGGAFLNTVLTSEKMAVRLLGTSSAPVVSTSTLLIATGNNLVLLADMARRVLLCKLDSGKENPETRKFEFDPEAILKAYRGEYVVAALTVLRAMAVAGYPYHGKAPLNGYNLWDQWVRGSLIWLGYDDPVASQGEVRALDPARTQLSNLLQSWHELFGSTNVRCREVVAAASEREGSMPSAEGGWSTGALRNPGLRDALVSVAAAGPDRPDATKLGYYCKSVEGRPLGGLKLVRGPDVQKSASWIVMEHTDGK